jgi:hypothetical protein
MKKGTYIQILDHSDWHKLFGIVDDIIDGIPLIMTPTRPLERYWLYENLRDKVIVVK